MKSEKRDVKHERSDAKYSSIYFSFFAFRDCFRLPTFVVFVALQPRLIIKQTCESVPIPSSDSTYSNPVPTVFRSGSGCIGMWFHFHQSASSPINVSCYYKSKCSSLQFRCFISRVAKLSHSAARTAQFNFLISP